MLTTAQQATLKAAILAENDPVFVAARNARNDTALAAFYNEQSSPAFYVWRSSVNTDNISDAINWALLTPADVPNVGDSAQVAAAQTTRALICQAKQINLQIMLQGRSAIDATKLRVRQALTDSLQNVPSGASGASQDAGWAQVKATMYRQVTRGERLYATGTGTTGVPGLAGWEGEVSTNDISAVLNEA